MRRLTLFFLVWLLINGATFAAAIEPCTTRNLDFDQKTANWKHLPISKLKKDTVYTLHQADGRTVLHGDADSSASFFASIFRSAVEVPSSISWRWKTDSLVPGADNRDKKREDAPLRVIVAFAGDFDKLPEEEIKRFKRAKALSGRELPYAMLMYIWSNHVPVNTVIPSAHTSQVKMLVAASGVEGLGQWQKVKRNLADDYQRAFGANPGPVFGVAVMTDTDNTHTKAVGEYAEILLECSRGGAK